MPSNKRIRSVVAVGLIGAAIALVPVGPPAAADLCGTRPYVVPGPSGALFYVQDRVAPGSQVPVGGVVGGEGTWIYMESNNKANLQNWGAWPGPLSALNKDTCTGSGAPDTLIL